VHTKVSNILYDPVKARVLFDFLVSSGSTLGIYLIFLISTNQIDDPAFLVFLPFLYTLSNYYLGLYSKFRLANVTIKVLIIALSGLVALILAYFLKTDMLIASLSIAFTIPLSSVARWLTNLPHQSVKSDYLEIITSSNQPVLVVGGGGYIGSHVVEQLIINGEKVRVFDKFYYSKNVFKNLLNNKNLEIFEGDISDLYSLTLALKDIKTVVHLAGIVGDPAAKIDENLTRHLNIVTTRMLKETVKAFRIPQFIFASSCSVYGTQQDIVSETSQLNPVSLYAQTKIDSENDLLKDPFDHFHPTVLRFATVFGHSKRMRFDLVANLFCAQAYHNGKITVIGGDQWRPFIHVKDISKAVVKVINSPQETVSRQIFNVGDNAMNLTINDLAHLVTSIIKEDKKGNKTQVIVKKDIQDTRNYNVSFDKIANKLNFASTINFENGISEIHSNLMKNNYKHHYTNKIYSNFETTKLIHEEFVSRKYREKHYSILSTQAA